MATSSRGDKGKPPMVEREDIGSEEGELLDVHPPLPELVGRSGSDRKRKKHAREEEGPLAVVLLPPTAEEKRAENARKKAENDENYRKNSIFKHRWLYNTDEDPEPNIEAADPNPEAADVKAEAADVKPDDEFMAALKAQPKSDENENDTQEFVGLDTPA
ncbi:hypothetical protein R1sor_009404 [Riccia sorocarpa]|uniref:Uncharacterized protein n=1 Tax=Riccia sorocarpa TaxID=122646 RepID=A0ABD3HV12_9MARC